MLNILINAYAVSPSWGSEPGMGWNWVINIAQYCNVHVITEGEWKKEIETALHDLPYKENIHFYYLPVSEKIRKMCWNQGDWRFYYYYRKWQKKALKTAKSIIEHNQIDVIHQLNMIGFREPGYLWKIKEIPFVWGPIGGMELTSMLMMKHEPIKNIMFEFVKNKINVLQIKFMPRVRNAINGSNILVAATKSTYNVLSKFYNKPNVYFINETGLNVGNLQIISHTFEESKLKLLWIGKFAFRKKLDLALDTIAQLSDIDYQFTIAGTGTIAEMNFYKSYAEKLGIQNKIQWLGKVPHEKINKLMNESDVLFFTSISDATSTVIPEAISCNLPIICFNICGFGPLVKDRVGETIELTNHKKAAQDFAEKIRYLYNHRERLKEYSLACDKYKEELSWNWKARKMVEIYNQAIYSHRQNLSNK